ncbi:MAG: hypothetical protein K9H84_07190, partial [Bacteroidales bacterium]|nr:hypothetical protein [Bacteroidales bacterium]
VGNQVESKENESDTSKDSRLSYQESNYVGDIVRAIVGNVVSDIVNSDYSADNQSGISEDISSKDKSEVVNEIVNNILSYRRGNQVYIINIELDDDVFNQLSYQVSNQVGVYVREILSFCRDIKKRKDILENLLGISNQTKNYNNHIKSLIDSGLLLPLKKRQTSSKQSYQTSIKGKILLLIMSIKDD